MLRTWSFRWRIQPASSGTVKRLLETCVEMCSMDLTEVYSPALFYERSTQTWPECRVAEDLETGWNQETKSMRDKGSSELRIARPKVLIANPPCSTVL